MYALPHFLDPTTDAARACRECGCDVEDSVGLGRECERSANASRSDRVSCIGCCAYSPDPCDDCTAEVEKRSTPKVGHPSSAATRPSSTGVAAEHPLPVAECWTDQVLARANARGRQLPSVLRGAVLPAPPTRIGGSDPSKFASLTSMAGLNTA